jgi:hypothetical protein
MSEEWKKHDRPCAPCVDCGAELYEKFWGSGGWARTDKTTDEAHSDSDCVANLKANISDADDALTGLLNDMANNPDRKLPHSRQDWSEALERVRVCLRTSAASPK